MTVAPDTWRGLNDALRSADEERCRELSLAELTGKRRLRHLIRIHSRLNKVRADRERMDLIRACGTGGDGDE